MRRFVKSFARSMRKIGISIEGIHVVRGNVVIPEDRNFLDIFLSEPDGEKWIDDQYFIKEGAYGVFYKVPSLYRSKFEDWISDHGHLLKTMVDLFIADRLYCSVLKFVEAIENIDDIEEICERMIKELGEIFHFDIGVYANYDRVNNMVIAREPGYNVKPEEIRDFRFPFNEASAAYKAYKKKYCYWTNDAMNDSNIENFEVERLCVIPLFLKDRLFGFIYGARKKGSLPFAEEEISLMDFVSSRISAHFRYMKLSELSKVKSKALLDLDNLSGILASKVDLDKVLNLIVDKAVVLFESDGASLMINNEKRDGFIIRAFSGISDAYASKQFVPREKADEFIGKISGDSYFIPNLQEQPFGDVQLIKKEGLVSCFSAPLQKDTEFLGILNIYWKHKVPFREEFLEIILPFSLQAAVAIRNAELYSNAVQTTESIIKALSELESEKDIYTLNHSERVALLSLKIARNKGIKDKEELYTIEKAALLHDVGKITIEKLLLHKTEPLTEQELIEVRMHPEVGANIIEKIRGMKEVARYVLYHHERWDGKGYPGGLREDAIPLGSRIINLADSIEAMLSDRPYRKGLPIKEIKKELKRESGKQFDPFLVPIAVEILEAEKW